MKPSERETVPDGSFRILNTEPGRFSEAARAALRRLGDVAEVEADREYLLAHVADFQILLIALRNTIDAQIIRRAEQLLCIVTPTTGTNHIDCVAARQNGIEVLSLHGETEFLRGITATAELTWALLLSLLRKVPAAHASVLEAKWQRDLFYGNELKGKTLGILGYGRLGRMVATYGRAFGMSVVAFDRHGGSGLAAEANFLGLREVLERSDVVSIHLPLTDETRGLLCRERFEEMKPGAILINTARGEVVEEKALIVALTNGKIAGAAMDVLAQETSLDPQWLANSELRKYAASNGNLLITPHIGGVTHESVDATNRFMIAKLERFLAARGRPTP